MNTFSGSVLNFKAENLVSSLEINTLEKYQKLRNSDLTWKKKEKQEERKKLYFLLVLLRTCLLKCSSM